MMIGNCPRLSLRRLIVGVATVMTACGSTALAQERIFPSLMNLGGYSHDYADINGDQRIDVITVQDGRSEFAIEFAREGGTFSEPIYVQTGSDVIGVTAADFNGDGHIDIATVLYSESYACVHLNRGDGTFAPRKDIWVGMYLYLDGITSVDLNNDGLSELVVSNSSSGSLYTFQNLGDGLFQSVDLAGASGGTTFQFVDLNNDSLLDIVSANRNLDLLRYSLNLGEFQFESPVLVNDPDTQDARYVSAGDMDADGDIDLVTSGPALQLWRNEHGVFVGPNDIGNASLCYLVRDLNGDGAADLISMELGSLFIDLNSGDGLSFTRTEIRLWQSGDRFWLEDLNGDGIEDLAVSFIDSMTTFIGLGDGRYQSHGHVESNNPRSAQLVDIDLDGDQDIITCAGDGLVIFQNDGQQAFSEAYEYFISHGLVDLVAIDLNGDQYPDIAAIGSTNTNKVVVLLNNHGEGYHAPVQYGAFQATREIVAADVDSDKDLDLLIACDGSRSGLLRNNGDGSFSLFEDFGSFTAADSISIGDLDGDQDLDIFLTSASERYPVRLYNDGSGSFERDNQCCNGKWAQEPYDSALGDMNGDGVLDLVTSHRFGQVGILLFDDFGNTHQLYSHGPGTEYRDLELVDIDLDGDLDTLVADRSGAVRVMLNAGNGLTERVDSYSTLVSPEALCVGDADLDEAPDLVVSGRTADAVVLMRNLRSGQSVCLPDLNADGSLNFFDISSFLVAYLDGDLAVDFNGDGELNFFDVTAFIAAFNAGCP